MGAFLSVHTVNQMQLRGISRDELEFALAAEGRTTYPSEDGPDRTVILSHTGTGRRLKIVVLTAEPDYIVTVAGRDEEG